MREKPQRRGRIERSRLDAKLERLLKLYKQFNMSLCTFVNLELTFLFAYSGAQDKLTQHDLF